MIVGVLVALWMISVDEIVRTKHSAVTPLDTTSYRAAQSSVRAWPAFQASKKVQPKVAELGGDMRTRRMRAWACCERAAERYEQLRVETHARGMRSP